MRKSWEFLPRAEGPKGSRGQKTGKLSPCLEGREAGLALPKSVQKFPREAWSPDPPKGCGRLSLWTPGILPPSAADMLGSGPAEPVRPSWPPTSPGRKEFNGGQVLGQEAVLSQRQEMLLKSYPPTATSSEGFGHLTALWEQW